VTAADKVNAVRSLLEILVIVAGGFRVIYKLNKRLDRIEYQLYENGGSSMKDQMNRQDETLNKLVLDLAVLHAKLGE
jgi:chitinase